MWAWLVQLERMWAWLIPVLKSVLVNFSIESLADWGTCFATASVGYSRFYVCDKYSLVAILAAC